MPIGLPQITPVTSFQTGFVLKIISKADLHPRLGVLLYISHITWWFLAIYPISVNLVALKIFAGIFTLFLNLITGLHAYHQYQIQKSRFFTVSTTNPLCSYMLIGIVNEIFCLNYNLNRFDAIFIFFYAFALFSIGFDLISFRQVLKTIFLTPGKGGIVVRSWSNEERILLTIGNSVGYLGAIYYLGRLWFFDSSIFLKYPDWGFASSFLWHTIINYCLLIVLILSLFQRGRLNKAKFQALSSALGMLSIFIYVATVYGRDVPLFLLF